MERNGHSGTIYKRKGSDFYYCHFIDPSTGRQVRLSTKTCDEAEARAFLEDRMRKAGAVVGRSRPTMGEMISLYEDVATNPRYRQAKIDGYNYGYNYARHMASAMRSVRQALEKGAPALLKKPIDEITSLDMRNIKNCLIDQYGRRGKTDKFFSGLKTVFSQAHEDGIINTNPAFGTRNIKYDRRERMAIRPEDVVDIIKLKGRLQKMGRAEEWAYFTIAATTGMRRGEILALNRGMIDGDILFIRHAMKLTEKGYDPDMPPKWDNDRTVPLSDITKEALAVLRPSRNGRLFNREYRWVDGCMDCIVYSACCCIPEKSAIWGNVTSHVLRHTLESSLYIAGLPPYMIARYLGWEHGTSEFFGSQKRYTHLYARNLYPVSRVIDALFSADDSKRVGLEELQGNKMLLSCICTDRWDADGTVL